MLEIRVTGINSTVTRLNKIVSSLENPTEFFKGEAILVLEEESKEVFDTEGFGSWPALDPEYAARKFRAVGNKTILRLSDDYFLSMTQSTHAGAERDIDRERLLFGFKPEFFVGKSGVPYPIFHESRQQPPPYRPVLTFLIEQRVVTRLSRSYANYVKTVIRRT